jgi:glycosyltransferase involved in cell wall biosynthesis
MTVSVIVASYNYGRYLREALDSILAQTFQDLEAIIVDDGSTDNSRRIATSYLSDSRFRLLERQHQGQSATKNSGIAASHGQFIAFLDADDRWHPTKLAKQVALMSRPNVGVVYSRRRKIGPAGEMISGDDRHMHRGYVTSYMYRDNFICFSSSLVRRNVFDRIGTFDERINLAIDFDLWLRASRICEFDYVNEPLVDYRVGHGNLSRRVAERLDTVLAIMERFRTEIDRPAMLDPVIAKLALAETYRHRGIVARAEPNRGLGWLWSALRIRPGDFVTWRALAAALAPSSWRRWRRRLLGVHDWEAGLIPTNRRAA